MSPEHKSALASGRNEGRAVRAYLEALEAHRPKRGRKRTSESIKKRLAAIDEQLASADPLSRVKLLQEQMNLRSELEQLDHKVDLGALEEQFISVAQSYSQRKGISYSAWRAIGVAPTTLKRAGIARSA